LLLIKAKLLLETIMDFVCKMAKEFRLIREEQHIILNLLQIKAMRLLNSVMRWLWVIAWARQWT
jgi:hypothetical protein